MIKKTATLSLLLFSFTILNANWRELRGYNKDIFNNIVKTTCSDKYGNIYAAGSFKNDSGKFYVAKWNGSEWIELGGINSLNANGTIHSICSDSAGNIYAAGFFKNSNGKCYVAKWNGNNWNEIIGLNSLMANDTIRCITIDKSGNLYATGNFYNKNFEQYVAKWNGIEWKQLGGTNAWYRYNIIRTITFDDSGNIYVGGGDAFGINSYKPFIAKWDGVNWSNLFLNNNNGPNVSGAFVESILFDSGKIYISGPLVNDDNNNLSILKWNGNNWSEVGNTNIPFNNNSIIGLYKDKFGFIYAGTNNRIVLKFDGSSWINLKQNDLGAGTITSIFMNNNDEIIVNGYSNNLYLFYKWNGKNWEVLNGFNELNGRIKSICSDHEGNIYASGDLTTKFNRQENVYKWNGNNWNELGGIGAVTTNTTGGTIGKTIIDNKGIVYITDPINNRIKKWNKTSWTTDKYLDTLSNITSITCDSNGNLYASKLIFSKFQPVKSIVKKWDGNKWIVLGNAFENPLGFQISTMCTDKIGNIYVAGDIKNDSNSFYVAKWNGTEWRELGGLNSLKANKRITNISIDKNGNLYAVGSFTNSNGKFYIAKWDGVNWSEIGSNNTFNNGIAEFSIDKNGNIYLIGAFTNSNGNYYIAKWDGNNWSELGGLNNASGKNYIHAIHIDNKDNLYVGGSFYNSNGRNYIAKWSICDKVITQQPKDQAMFDGTATFSCNSNDSSVNYQWQINGGSGWNNLSDIDQFSGSNTNKLTLKDVTISNNNQKFRCIINGKCLVDTTNQATLKIWGLNNNSKYLHNFKIFPNPSTDILNIYYYNKLYELRVYNSIGKIIYNKSFNQNDTSILINTWPVGIYQIELIDLFNNCVIVQKFVKL
jgi:hypothetical protein